MNGERLRAAHPWTAPYLDVLGDRFLGLYHTRIVLPISNGRGGIDYSVSPYRCRHIAAAVLRGIDEASLPTAFVGVRSCHWRDAYVRKQGFREATKKALVRAANLDGRVGYLDGDVEIIYRDLPKGKTKDRRPPWVIMIERALARCDVMEAANEVRKCIDESGRLSMQGRWTL